MLFNNEDKDSPTHDAPQYHHYERSLIATSYI